MPVIRLNQVSKSYKSEFLKKRKTAVSKVSFEITRGEIFGIIGANGAGKSTLIKMIQGFIRPDTGEIEINGKKPSDPDSRSAMGYLPENPYFYSNLSVSELLKFSTSASGITGKKARRNIQALLKAVNLYDHRHQRLKTYSKGMTQRAGICFALVHDPDIIVLDEPMSGLDPLGRKMVIDLIRDLQKRGKTILFCSHILNDVERICDRVAVMDSGVLKRIFKKDSLTDHSMEDLFLETIQVA